MSALLHNMSAPPRSEVKFSQEQLKRYISFNPMRLERLLKANGYSGEDVAETTKRYVEDHKDIYKSIKKPTGYMIAEFIELPTGKRRYTKEINGRLGDYKYTECTDLELIILVLCSTVEDLYIPNRTLSFESSKFNKILLFPEEEVMS